MAVYTPLEAAEVGALLTEFGLGPLEKLEPIPQGIENTVYRVWAGGRALVLTVFERDDAERVEAVLRLTGALAGQAVPCAAPIQGPGGPLARVRGKPAALAPFVEGRVIPTPSEPHLEALGAALARLHTARADRGFEGAGPHRAAVLVPLARRLAQQVRERDAGLAGLLEDEAHHQEGVAEEGLPWGLLHGDLFLDNVLFDPDRPAVRALLDFQMAGIGPWVYDLAVILLDAGWSAGAIEGDRARALLRGYRAVRPVAGEEFRCLPDYLRRAALRFLCLRLERFVVAARPMAAGQGKDPGEVAEKLRTLRRGSRRGTWG
ncbi:MAG: homoserine kinase [Thermodesulfobacteriota bacterium]